MTDYELELQNLKTWDEVQSTSERGGYQFIMTAGHGYLVVPKNDKFSILAKSIISYGFTGKLAYYLEEDNEAPTFWDRMTKQKFTEEHFIIGRI